MIVMRILGGVSLRACFPRWRTTTGQAVDFVAEHEGRLLPIEVKTAARPRLASFHGSGRNRSFLNPGRGREILPHMPPEHAVPPETPTSRQLELFQVLTPSQHSNTIDIFDSIPKYEYRLTKAKGTYLKKRAFKFHNQVIRAEIKPAILGTDRAVFPGEREEALEMTLRYLISQGLHQVVEESDKKTGEMEVSMVLTLYQIRQELARNNHTYSYSQVNEALDVLTGTRIKLVLDLKKSRGDGQTARFDQEDSIIRFARMKAEGDLDGRSTFVKVTFHPLVQRAIYRTYEYRRYNFALEMQLRRSLSRWLYRRLVNRFRYADHGQSYHISLTTIKEESPIPTGIPMREALRQVCEALDELASHDIIAPPWGGTEPYTVKKETTKITKGKGRPSIKDAVFEIYPSTKFCQDIKDDNVERKRLVPTVSPPLLPSPALEASSVNADEPS